MPSSIIEALLAWMRESLPGYKLSCWTDVLDGKALLALIRKYGLETVDGDYDAYGAQDLRCYIASVVEKSCDGFDADIEGVAEGDGNAIQDLLEWTLLVCCSGECKQKAFEAILALPHELQSIVAETVQRLLAEQQLQAEMHKAPEDVAYHRRRSSFNEGAFTSTITVTSQLSNAFTSTLTSQRSIARRGRSPPGSDSDDELHHEVEEFNVALEEEATVLRRLQELTHEEQIELDHKLGYLRYEVDCAENAAEDQALEWNSDQACKRLELQEEWSHLRLDVDKVNDEVTAETFGLFESHQMLARARSLEMKSEHELHSYLGRSNQLEEEGVPAGDDLTRLRRTTYLEQELLFQMDNKRLHENAVIEAIHFELEDVVHWSEEFESQALSFATEVIELEAAASREAAEQAAMGVRIEECRVGHGAALEAELSFQMEELAFLEERSGSVAVNKLFGAEANLEQIERLEMSTLSELRAWERKLAPDVEETQQNREEAASWRAKVDRTSAMLVAMEKRARKAAHEHSAVNERKRVHAYDAVNQVRRATEGYRHTSDNLHNLEGILSDKIEHERDEETKIEQLEALVLQRELICAALDKKTPGSVECTLLESIERNALRKFSEASEHAAVRTSSEVEELSKFEHALEIAKSCEASLVAKVEELLPANRDAASFSVLLFIDEFHAQDSAWAQAAEVTVSEAKITIGTRRLARCRNWIAASRRSAEEIAEDYGILSEAEVRASTLALIGEKLKSDIEEQRQGVGNHSKYAPPEAVAHAAVSASLLSTCTQALLEQRSALDRLSALRAQRAEELIDLRGALQRAHALASEGPGPSQLTDEAALAARTHLVEESRALQRRYISEEEVITRALVGIQAERMQGVKLTEESIQNNWQIANNEEKEEAANQEIRVAELQLNCLETELEEFESNAQSSKAAWAVMGTSKAEVLTRQAKAGIGHSSASARREEPPAIANVAKLHVEKQAYERYIEMATPQLSLRSRMAGRYEMLETERQHQFDREMRLLTSALHRFGMRYGRLATHHGSWEEYSEELADSDSDGPEVQEEVREEGRNVSMMKSKLHTVRAVTGKPLADIKPSMLCAPKARATRRSSRLGAGAVALSRLAPTTTFRLEQHSSRH